MSYSFEQFTSLSGPNLTLCRIEAHDLPSLATTLVSPTTWFSKTRNLQTPKLFIEYFANLLIKQEKGELLALAAYVAGNPVAMSVYQYPSENFRRVEIGFTWLADPWQRTFVNSELKLLMLDYAFNEMKVVRVEFSVHPKNEKSNRAMRRIGATLEGTLRKWRFLPGSVPDDGNRNIYSILDDEWPALRAQLASRLGPN